MGSHLAGWEQGRAGHTDTSHGFGPSQPILGAQQSGMTPLALLFSVCVTPLPPRLSELPTGQVMFPRAGTVKGLNKILPLKCSLQGLPGLRLTQTS